MRYEKTSTDRVFPLFVRPQKDELLSSWIFRTSYSHQIKLQTFCKVFLNNTNIWNRDIDRSAPPYLLSTMACKSDTSYTRALQTTLASYETYLFEKLNQNGNSKFILPLGVYHRLRKRYSQLFCPRCLKADSKPYFRKAWRLSVSVVCSSCKCYLLDKCGNCGEAINFHRQDLGRKSEYPKYNITNCYQCHEDLSYTEAGFASNIDLQMQKRLDSFIANGYTGYTTYSHLFFDGLYMIFRLLLSKKKKLQRFRSLVHQVSPFDLMENTPQKDAKFEFLPLDKRLSILRSAFWLLSDWPDRFLEIVRESKTSMSYLISYSNPVPYWYYKVVSVGSSSKFSAFHNHGSY